MKFAHLAETYKTTFESLDDGKRVANPALNQQAILEAQPEWGRNEYTGFTQYRDSRIFDGKAHEAAMADVEKLVKWQPDFVPSVAPQRLTAADVQMLQN